MDKENNNNIEDILKLLKNTVKNTDNSPADSVSTDGENTTGDLNPELLKEKLREQFMSGDQRAEESVDEYTIDKDLISEFYKETEKAEEQPEIPEIIEESPQEEPVVIQEDDEISDQQAPDEFADEMLDDSDAEDLSAREGEIVEIVIPWVDAIEESAHESEVESDDFGGDDDELYDEDASENSYICFADETVSDDDILAEGEEEFDKAEQEVEELVVDEQTEPQYELKTISEEVDDDDDLPWIEEDSVAPVVYGVVEGTATYDDDLAQDEPSGEVEVEVDVVEDIFDDEREESYDKEEQEPSVVLEEQVVDEVASCVTLEKTTHSADDEEGTSFYRTMIEARDELESTHGYPRTSVTEGYQSELEHSEKEIELPYFNGVKYSLSEDEADASAVSDGDTKTDFYGVDEHNAHIEEDRVHIEEQKAEEIDFEDETPAGGDITEILAGSVWSVIKPILLGILALGVLVFEMLPILGIVPDGILDYTSYPWTYILIDAQLLIFSAALCYEKMFDGLRKTITPESNFYSLLSVGVIVTLLNNLIACFSANYGMPRLYSFIMSAYIFVMCIIEKENAKRIKESLGALEAQTVFSLRRSQGKNSCAEKMYMGGVDPDTSILEPVEIKTERFDSAFIRETSASNKNWHNSIVFSSVVPAVIFAIIVAVIVTVLGFGLAASISAFTFVFVSIAPLSAIISYYLPIFISYRRLRDRGCYITGYDGAYEMSDCDAVVFNDCHLFKPCSAKEAGIKLYCSESKTRELLVALAAVYSKLGGPMRDTFSSVLGDEAHSVNMIRITRNGFEAVVDGKMSLIVGSSDYLARYGIVTDRSDAKDPGVLFVALNSVLSAKISVKYRTQPLFEALCTVLDEHDVRCVIETYDPVISGKYVARCRETDGSVSVVHKNVNDYNMPPSEKAAIGKFGAFCTASRLKLVELVVFCKKLIGLRKINTAILIASYVSVAVISILLAVGGAIENVNLLWALLYQAVLIAAYVVAAVKFLPLSFDAVQDKKEREENRKQEKENSN